MARADDAARADPGRVEDSRLRAFWRKFHSGADLLARVPAVAYIDASWSLAINAGTLEAARQWDTPRGLVAHFGTRALFGTTWTLVLGGESLALALGMGGNIAWARQARWRTDALVGLGVPAGCVKPGSNAGCGMGFGTFGGLRFELRSVPLWVEASGGWIEQRVASDPSRTLAESTWLMTPLHVFHEAHVERGPFRATGAIGPSVDVGMHTAHLHPPAREGGPYPRNWLEMHPLDGGLGGGIQAEVRLEILRRFSIDADAHVSALAIGFVERQPNAALAPLDAPRAGGIPVFRRYSFGVAYHWKEMPLRLGLSYWAAEMSTRSLWTLGHEAVLLRFDFPLRTAEDAPARPSE